LRNGFQHPYDHKSRRSYRGFLHTAVTTAGQVTSYLVAHSTELRPPPVHPAADHRRPGRTLPAARRPPPDAALVNPLTPAEQRVLQLLPASTYNQIAATLYVSRAQAIQRAIDLRIL
jgi:LuxR family transcriptional regulator, maltose regulon positive regulatory protein